MTEFIDLIWCKIIILTNSLPIYQIAFSTYLSIPVLVISLYYFRNNQSKPALLSLILLFIWVSQVLIWTKCHELYYKL